MKVTQKQERSQKRQTTRTVITRKKPSASGSSPNFRDAKLPFGSDKCRCPNCYTYLNTSALFEEHRVGSFPTARQPRLPSLP